MDWNFGCWLDDVNVNAIPVQVVGVQEEGMFEFPNLAAARKFFPELDPYNSSEKFTWAMRGELNEAPALRFETWAAYKFFSE
jgi:hypothetical protein